MKYLLLIIFITSCANPDANFRRRNVDEYFNGSGVVQYFLPDLPAWANTVPSMNCRREKSVRFFDFSKLKSSFGLNYDQMLQLQLAFNIDRNDERAKGAMALTEEERLFYSVSERVQAGIVPFKKPDFKMIHLVVVDPFIEAEVYRSFFKLITSKEFQNGYPVFVSLCYGDAMVRKLVLKAGFKGKFEVMPASMFAPYSPDGVLETNSKLYVEDFFGKDKNIKVYIPKGFSVPEIIGTKTKYVY